MRFWASALLRVSQHLAGFYLWLQRGLILMEGRAQSRPRRKRGPISGIDHDQDQDYEQEQDYEQG